LHFFKREFLTWRQATAVISPKHFIVRIYQHVSIFFKQRASQKCQGTRIKSLFGGGKKS